MLCNHARCVGILDLKVALVQFNPTVGDIDGNTRLILERIDAARAAGATLVLFPELAVFGYPPKDLVHRRDLVARNEQAVQRIAEQAHGLTVLVGFVQRDAAGSGKGIYNAAAVCRDGRIIAAYQKMLLPTYDVFDEARYFTPGREVVVFDQPTDAGTVRFGLSICEDLWNDEQFDGRRVYGVDPVARTVAAGAQVLLNLSGSPFRVGVEELRTNLFGKQSRAHRTPVLYVNQVAGNDDLLFDGGSFALDARGEVVARARAFDEDILLLDLDGAAPRRGRIEPYPDATGSIHAALVLGIRDYMRKCGFREAVVGLSGGIDSALTAALAVEALGPDRVFGVCMPSRYTQKRSVDDARALAENLRIPFEIIPIEDVHSSYERALQPHFAGRKPDVTEENIQARIRGNLLMSLSNKFGRLLLTTGNKSELAVGYCTLYGDMCGGLAVLSDVPKTLVYELSRRINATCLPPYQGGTEGGSSHAPAPMYEPQAQARGSSPLVRESLLTSARPLIPQSTIDRPPTAELRENQTDQDSLPPYDTLNAILERYVEGDRTIEEIAAEGFDRATVERVARMVNQSEYKRKQSPVGLKVTSRAFGTGRRMPIAAKHA